eukprot:EG_transcript_50419
MYNAEEWGKETEIARRCKGRTKAKKNIGRVQSAMLAALNAMERTGRLLELDVGFQMTVGLFFILASLSAFSLELDVGFQMTVGLFFILASLSAFSLELDVGFQMTVGLFFILASLS